MNMFAQGKSSGYGSTSTTSRDDSDDVSCSYSSIPTEVVVDDTQQQATTSKPNDFFHQDEIMIYSTDLLYYKIDNSNALIKVAQTLIKAQKEAVTPEQKIKFKHDLMMFINAQCRDRGYNFAFETGTKMLLATLFLADPEIQNTDKVIQDSQGNTRLNFLNLNSWFLEMRSSFNKEVKGFMSPRGIKELKNLAELNLNESAFSHMSLQPSTGGSQMVHYHVQSGVAKFTSDFFFDIYINKADNSIKLK